MTDVREGNSCRIAFSILQNDGTALPEADILTLTLKLYDVDTLTVINGKNDINIKDANGGELDTDGTGTVDLEADDNIIVSTRDINEEEIHAALIKFTAVNGVSGSAEVRFNVIKIG